MLTRKLSALSIGLMAASLCLATSAYADHGKGKYKNNGHKGSAYEEQEGVAVITIGDRAIIQQYLAKNGRKCPPGLAKKNNGCLPPGQAKKYRVGQVIPGGVVYTPIPRDLLVRLSPLPLGYAYVQVDKDVLLIAEASKKVIDAVTLLSALGK